MQVLDTMNTKCLRIKRLIALLVIVVLASGFLAVRSHLEIQDRIRATENYNLLFDKLAQDRQLNTILKRIQAGEVEEGAHQLSVLLSRNILLVNSRLAFADERTRSLARFAFCWMGQFQPKRLEKTAEAFAHGLAGEEKEAQRILALAVAAEHMAEERVSASR